MVELLRKIRSDSDRDNHWQGEGPARLARALLAGLPADADPIYRRALLLGVAEHELRLGNEEEAIRRFEEALALDRTLGSKLSSADLGHDFFRSGVAYLRLGETRNCAQGHVAEACILPLRGRALHIDTEGSRRAMERFQQAAEMLPDSPLFVKASWLLNLAAMTVGGYPDQVPPSLRLPPALFTSSSSFPRFENVAASSGIHRFNLFGGAVLDDFDGDDRLDVVTTTFDLAGDPAFLQGDGHGGFRDRTAESGLGDLWGGLNLVQADYDNDGDLDLYVLRGAWLYTAGRHPNSLLRNDGHGVFTDVSFEAGLGEPFYPTQTAAWADYDNDGWVDLFVGNEHGDGRRRVGLDGAREGTGDERPDFDAPSQLFHNDGNGRFTEVSRRAGIDLMAFVKGVVWGDYDGDRWPDLYVSVLGAPNRLYHNRGDGTFEEVAARLGVELPLNSFPVWFWDYDNDGALDLYVSSYRGSADSVALVAASALGLEVPYELARLYRGDGHGGFVEVAKEVGLDRLHLPMGANFGDVDGDGYLDFYLGTGYPDYEALVPSVLYWNRGGRRFDDVTYAAGVGHLQKGHAVAFGDVDGDGDLDIYTQMGGAFPGDRFDDALFRNPGFGHHWITLRLEGRRTNRAAIGARIRVDVTEQGSPRSIYRTVTSGGSFGASPLRQTIGLGGARGVDRIVVWWPSTGETQELPGPPVDRSYLLVEGETELAPLR